MPNLPVFNKTWDFNGLNIPIVYVSLNDTMATLLYGIKNYLVATMGATVVFSGNGTTSGASDFWTSKAACTTRGATTAAANSFCVIQWAGVQLCISYVGGTDDVARFSFSQSSLFILNATNALFTPTATDEAIFSTGNSITGTVTSGNRVYSIEATSDRSIFRCFVYRQGALQRCLGLERFIEAPGVLVGTVLGWNSPMEYSATNSTGNAWGWGNGAAGGNGCYVIYYSGAPRACIGGTVVFNGTYSLTSVSSTSFPVNGGYPMFPIFLGSADAGVQAYYGIRYDAFVSHGGAAAYDVSDDPTAGTRVAWAGANMQTPWSPSQGVVTA